MRHKRRGKESQRRYCVCQETSGHHAILKRMDATHGLQPLIILKTVGPRRAVHANLSGIASMAC